ncbi:hypothetical protein MKX03_014706 [Papaver bracteatum]|nr:hypothetical protein MKX03_014706 [Papaver bracteatum]
MLLTNNQQRKPNLSFESHSIKNFSVRLHLKLGLGFFLQPDSSLISGKNLSSEVGFRVFLPARLEFDFG